ncbi:MAG: excinuclease ABC subunit UvrA [Candidatus Cryptobacteroides sp.]
MMENEEFIQIRGAHAHNLKNVDVDIPRGKLTVITGLSGSGKSSLAFDTVFAEGQRRYMNTLSPYAKYFMGVMEKPEVESINGLSPVIAIEQKTTGNNPRSTVGTITEISDFLRLLFARVSTAYSPVTGREMVRYTDEQIVDLITERYKDKRCLLLAPLVRGRKGSYKELFEQLRKKGYTQVRVDSEVRELGEIDSLDRYKAHFVELVVDRLKPSESDTMRTRSSVAAALSLGKGSVAVYDVGENTISHFSKHLVDEESGLSLREPAPHSFSFNSPEGYCPHCKGLGTVPDINMQSIIPDRSKSVADGAIVPLGKARNNRKFEIVRAISRKLGFSIYDPVDEMPDEAVSLLVFGSDDLFRIGDGLQAEMVSWPGVVEDIEDRVVCPVCGGTRLNPETACFRIDGKTISDVGSMEISELSAWISSLYGKFDARRNAIASDILKELEERVRFLLDVGLDYLTLDRPASSLSGGEGQRIRLATQIGSKLVNVIYILDEPSIGLHPRDNRKLIASLRKLRDEGNTVLVVEHDEETMRAADWLVEVGPGAGENGGRICYSGPELHFENPNLTPGTRRSGNGKFLTLRGASGNNLKNVDVSFPLGCLICISGVSGSGKSTLINRTLMPVLKSHFYNYKSKPLPYAAIEGLENIDKVIEIDQSPIGRTPRSNPATYTGVFNDIRALFEDTTDAKVRGFKAGRFSFNVSGGRCEDCKGAGIKVIEMNFLPSVNVVCESCGGHRYKEDTLAVRYKGKNICEVLDMSIEEAYDFFRTNPAIAPKLKALLDVGLGYVRLGQSAVTLSGGECQRMKLASELARKSTGNTLYLLDEPTTGLHAKDVKVLMDVLEKLVDQGNTVIVIEHNPDVLKMADYLVDMGPGGGLSGGRVIATGTPEDVSRNPDSVTGIYLKELL